MPNLGPMELFFIFLIVVVLFGASRLPGIGRGIGEGIKNFKKGLKSDDQERLEDQREKSEHGVS